MELGDVLRRCVDAGRQLLEATAQHVQAIAETGSPAGLDESSSSRLRESLDPLRQSGIAGRPGREIVEALAKLLQLLLRRSGLEARGELLELVGESRIAAGPRRELVEPVGEALDPLGQLGISGRPGGKVVESRAKLL